MKNSLKHLARFALSLIVVAFAFAPKAFSAPAYPYPISYTQPDGTVITLRVHGDERFGYTTSGNIPVVKSQDGYFYYAAYTRDQINVTNIRVGSTQTKGSLPSPISADVIAYRKANSRLSNPFLDGGAYMRGIQMNSLKSKSPAQRATSTSVMTEPLVILVEYKDVKFTTSSPKTVFDNKLNSSAKAPLGSAKTYFADNSSGAYNPTFQIYGVVTLKNNSSYYAGAEGTDRAWEMVVEACEALNSSVNFKDFDQNNDGVLDNVALIFAGHNQAEGAASTTVWPHRYDVRAEKIVTVDGVTIGGYSVSSEFAGAQGTTISPIGTFVHEFSHVLGLLDIYDTNYDQGGQAEDIGSFSLMGSGNYNNSGNTPPYLNAVERNMLGWLNFEELPTAANLSLEPIGTSNKAYLIESGTADEYFIVETRKSDGWDSYISYTGASEFGLAVYHVDFNSQNKITTVDGNFTALELWQRNAPNAYAVHPCFKLLRSGEYVNNLVASSYLFPGAKAKTYISGTSSPAMVSWAGNKATVEMSNITASGSAVNFTVGSPMPRYKVSGTVVSQAEGTALSSVTVKLTPVVVQPTKGGEQGLSVINFSNLLTRSAGEISTQTNAQGQFTFENVDQGSYTLTAYLFGFIPYSQQVNIQSDSPLGSIALSKDTSSPIEKRVSHSSVITTGMLNGSTEGLAVYFTPETLAQKGVVGEQIRHMYILCGLADVRMSAKIYLDDVVVFSDEFVSSTGYNYIEIGSPVVVPSDKNLRLELTYETSTGTIVALDNGPAVTGGDLVKLNGAWISLKNDANIDTNIAMGFSVAKSSGEIASPEVELTALGQRYFAFVWDSSDLGVEQWEIDIVGSDGSKINQSATSRSFTAGGATPGVNYTVSVTPVVNGISGEAKTIEVTTPSITAPFSAMRIDDLGGGTYLFSYNNTPERPRKVTFYDGAEGSPVIDITNTYQHVMNFGEQADLTVTMIIEYADGTSETISRKIKY